MHQEATRDGCGRKQRYSINTKHRHGLSVFATSKRARHSRRVIATRSESAINHHQRSARNLTLVLLSYEFCLYQRTMHGDREEKRKMIIREIILTERKYVQRLELMQSYATAVSKSGLLSPHTLYLLFSNVKQILVFQRAFLSRMEAISNLPWLHQRWGRHFIEAEEDFVAAYEPWVSLQWTQNNLRDLASPPGPPVSNRVLQIRESLMAFDQLINPKTELPAFMIKPISRACKYPLLIECIIKTTSLDTYPHSVELQSGLDAAKRVADRLNFACRLSENVQTAEDLRRCVMDWQGHDVDSFGALLWDHERIVVTNFSDAEVVCRGFLFERIMLFCAPEAPVLAHYSRYRQTTPLVLKGHVLVANIMQTQPNPADSISLDVLWAVKHGLEVFTLRFKYECQMRWWETEIKKLIRDCAERRALERGHRRKSRRVSFISRDHRDGFESDDNLESLVEEPSLE
ncbi:Dbl homology domain-containing protein [Mycena sanguinolenta]|nr:Dbl homology domain-containing protein [Mycena sanguinolenta]